MVGIFPDDEEVIAKAMTVGDKTLVQYYTKSGKMLAEVWTE